MYFFLDHFVRGLIRLIFWIKVVMNNNSGKISLFEDKELRNLLHKTEVEDADRPPIITLKIINKILRIKYIIIVGFVHHRSFLDTCVHEKLAQKVVAASIWIGLPISDNWLLIHLLVSETFFTVLLSQFFYFLIFYFVFWEI